MEKQPDFPREVRKFTGGYIKNWEDGGETVELYHRLLEEVSEKNGVTLSKARVLEVGSGKAMFLDYLRAKGINAVGVDVRPRGNNESAQVIARAEQLPFGDGSFDVVFSSQLFDTTVYNQDHELMMKEIIRILSPGGIYVGVVEEFEKSEIKKFKITTDPDFPGTHIYKKP